MANDDIVLHGTKLGKDKGQEALDLNEQMAVEHQAIFTSLAQKEPTVTPGVSTDYYAGDKTWKDLAIAVRNVLLTGLNTSYVSTVLASDTIIGALGKLQGQLTSAFSTLSGKADSTAVDSALLLKSDKSAPYAMLGDNSATYPNSRRLLGTNGQIVLTDSGVGGSLTFTLADNPVLPGTGGVSLPVGTTAQRPSAPTTPIFRFNADNSALEYFTRNGWYNLVDTYGMKDSFDQTGFPNRTDSAIAFNAASRTFSITPTNGSTFDVYCSGKRIPIGAKTFQISDTEGFHFLQMDNTGTIIDAAGPIWSNVLLAAVVWSVSQQRAILFGDERHGTSMSPLTHQYLHTTRGTQYKTGLIAGNYTLVGTGTAAADTQLSISDGAMWDEDLLISITNNAPQQLSTFAKMPIWYRSGANGNWMVQDATNYPLMAGTRAKYNTVDGGGNWGLTDAPSDSFVAMWIVATNDIANPMVAIMGQYNSATLAQAQVDNTIATFNWGVMPVAEYKILYRCVFETKASYTNAVKAALRSITDMRGIEVVSTVVSTTATHSSLSGLNADDHPQYVHTGAARTITAQHTFAPSAAAPAFLLGANAQGQAIPGLNADLLDGLNSTDFVRNLGNVPSWTAGLLANRPAAGQDGRIYIARDVYRTYQDNGSGWDLIAIGGIVGGAVLQAIAASLPAVSGTTTKTDANTTPTITDGTQIWSQTITPTATSSKINIKGTSYVDHSNNNRRVAFGVFRGNVCIGVASTNVSQAGSGITLPLSFQDLPNTTSPVTYSIRAWANGAGTWYVNQASTPYFNGMLAKQTIEVQEVV